MHNSVHTEQPRGIDQYKLLVKRNCLTLHKRTLSLMQRIKSLIDLNKILWLILHKEMFMKIIQFLNYITLLKKSIAASTNKVNATNIFSLATNSLIDATNRIVIISFIAEGKFSIDENKSLQQQSGSLILAMDTLEYYYH